MSLFLPLKRATLLVPSGTGNDLDRKHLFILLMVLSRLSIVIRCYNEDRHIGRLLSGILQQTVKVVEIIVVDSGSTDATLTIAARYPVLIS